MIRRLQSFDFRKSAYVRVSDQWVCGYAGEGRPCRLGPNGRGRCQSQSECDPRLEDGDWVCTRPEAQGGACTQGPRRDGSCCQVRPPCVPQPSLRRRRGKVTFWATALTLAVMALSLGSQQRGTVFDPGPVIQGHGEVGDCGQCHVAFEGGPGAWLRAAFRPDDPHADSKKCVACHDRGEHATHPHNQAPQSLQRHTEEIKRNTPESSPALMVALRDQVFGLPEQADDALACATCHKEHRGSQFDATDVPDNRCQTCHAVKFDSFSDGHPPFDRYPYLRRTRLVFDHESHFNRNFAESKVKNPPETCASCHTPDPSGRYIVVKSFDDTCAACHDKDIRGEGLAGTKGIPVFALPVLDLDTLKEKGVDIGEWPEDAVAEELPPFMRLILAGTPGLAADLATVQRLELPDLESASKAELEAVGRVVWATKELFHDIVVTGAETVHARIEQSLDRALGGKIITQLIAQVPLDVVRGAQQDWFPRLGAEIEARRQKRAALEPRRKAGETQAAFSFRKIHTRQALTVFAAATGEASSRWAEPTPAPRIQLAQSGDDLLTDDSLIDKDALRLEDLEQLRQEDAAGDNGALGKVAPPAEGAAAQPAPEPAAAPAAEPAPEPAAAQAEEPAAAPQPEAPAAAPAAPAPVAQGGDELLQGNEGLIDKDALRLEDLNQLLQEDAAGNNSALGRVAPNDNGPAPAQAPSQAPGQAPAKTATPQKPAAPAQPKAAPEPEPEPEVADGFEPLELEVDPENWARFGGWFRQDYMLFYRPVTHQDPFMHAWIDLAARAQGTRAEPHGKALMAVFNDKKMPGKCSRCHSQEQRNVKGLAVNWKPFTPSQTKQPFTVFNHSFHFSLVGTEGCATCHKLQAGAKYEDSFKQLDPQVFQSNFAPMKMDVCKDCHVEESAGEACVQCHRFHVGEFPIIPVRTLVVDMAGPGAGGGAAAPATAPASDALAAGNGLAPSAPQPQNLAKAPANAAPAPAPAPVQVPSTAPAAQPSRSATGEVLPPQPPPWKRKQAASAPATSPALGSTTGQPLAKQTIYLLLSSHRTPEEAEGARRRLVDSFSDLLFNRDIFIDRLDQGDRGAFFRLLATAFPDERTAEATCRALQSRQQDCRVLSSTPRADDTAAR